MQDDLYVGPPTFSLAPQWPPHFFDSRIATAHHHCHQSQSCKRESRTQHHSHTKLGTFRSTTKGLLLTRQSIAFYSSRVMAADLG